LRCLKSDRLEVAADIPRYFRVRPIKLKEPNTQKEPFEGVVKSAQAAAVLVLVY
jgi:hypothetical protein